MGIKHMFLCLYYEGCRLIHKLHLMNAEMEKAMKHGFIRVAAATPKIRLADCTYNAKQVIKIIDTAEKQDVKLWYSQSFVLRDIAGRFAFTRNPTSPCKMQVKEIINFTKDKELLTIIGFPFEYEGRLYNTAADYSGVSC